MILFSSDHNEMYNYIINHFLELTIFSNEKGIDDYIGLFPDYLQREQYKKCYKSLEDLYLWSKDEFEHYMTAFHELALYKFLIYMGKLQKNDINFKKNYFDNKCVKLIENASREDYENDGGDVGLTFSDYRDGYYDVFSYIDYVLDDEDFLLIEDLYNTYSLGNMKFAGHFGININYYFELLPLDIQKHFKMNSLTLSGDVSNMLDYVNNRITDGSASNLFWEDNQPVCERKIQIIFDNLFSSYLCKQDFEIFWKSFITNNCLNFKLWKRRYENRTVLVQIRRAGSYLKGGYEKELLRITSENKPVYFVIICFTDEEYDKTVDFINFYVYTPQIQLYVNVQILDVRPKSKASYR